jgi:hypothetical protein
MVLCLKSTWCICSNIAGAPLNVKNTVAFPAPEMVMVIFPDNFITVARAGQLDGFYKA